MIRIFVELPPFRRYLDSLANGQEILKEIQQTLLESPDTGDVIQGTGGLRKMRHAGKGKGKSGGYRVTYLHRPEVQKIYLIVVYAENEQENLSAEERHALKQLVETLKRQDGKK
jgi:mRNA-degrading endonuclease RelE of RelBE toxin-antitoxin system